MITYSDTRAIDAKALSAVFEKSGIKRPHADLDRLQKMIDHADIVIGAWDGDRLVGVARAITDYSYCCYLSDLAVDEQYQRQSIGRQLVERLREKLGEQVSLLLISAPGAVDYYPKLGFEKSDRAYLIPRSQ